MVLKNWSVTSRNYDYMAPELTSFYLLGNVYGHPRFNDGCPIVTSKIIEIIDKGDYKEIITESGSIYELHKEDVNEEAEKQHPNYYERLKLVHV